MRAFFGGSYGGDNSKISDAALLECKICWYVYDPAEGDEYWQVPPGTPFSKLPGHWSCPNCDGKKDDFMVLEDSP
ncbi:MAG: rubredoxin [Candidatus Sedimenticola sp. 4PFRAG1]